MGFRINDFPCAVKPHIGALINCFEKMDFAL